MSTLQREHQNWLKSNRFSDPGFVSLVRQSLASREAGRFYAEEVDPPCETKGFLVANDKIRRRTAGACVLGRIPA